MEDVRTSFLESLGADGVLSALMAPLVRLVAQGDPVPVERLAAAARLSADQVESWLRSQPGTDWDSKGRLLGFGLTQRETHHRFVTDGRKLFTFCAADTLLFPPILGKAAQVRSACPATGTPIRMEVTPTAVKSLEPSTAVVTQIDLCDMGVLADIRGSTCDRGFFYATAQAAGTWHKEHPSGDVRPVVEFFELGRQIIHDMGWAA